MRSGAGFSLSFAAPVCCLLVSSLLASGHATEHDVHSAHRVDHGDQSIPLRRRYIWAKVCAPPQPFQDLQVLENYDSCGPTRLFGEGTVRDCVSSFVKSEERLSLQRMYQLICAMDAETFRDMDVKTAQCMKETTREHPNPLLRRTYKQLREAGKTAAAKARFWKNFALQRIKCQEKALSL